MNANTRDDGAIWPGSDQVQVKCKPRIERTQWLTELNGHPIGFIPLDQETRTHVCTSVMCHHLGRKEQTARGWACHEDGPLRPIRVNGRLAWAVADIKRILGA